MQLNLPLSTSIDIYDERNFISHDGNKEAFDFIKSINSLEGIIYLLSGKEKSGKTYLCHIWQRYVNAVFIDCKIFDLKNDEFIAKLGQMITEKGKYILEDLNQVDENKLLYLLNLIVEKHCVLLITSNKNNAEFNFKIKDLKSRFDNIINIKLHELNESSKQKVILKLLADRQMTLDSDVLDFISQKISGNYDVIFQFINSLEQLIQSGEVKKFTVNNVKNLLY